MAKRDITPERWARVEHIYHAALDRAPDGRATFLAEACQGDDELRDEVESLLREPVSGDGILELSPPGVSGALEEAWSPMTGHTLGAYRLERLIGAGGMGEVYQARDTKLGRDVAIKILPAGLTRDADRLARFEREARMLAALSHPNVCAIHGFEQADGLHYLILELVDGVTLASRLADARTAPDGPGLPMAEALSVARQIADALEAAHDKGIVHRDLKPANVCLTRDGVVKVLDFGLAKPVQVPHPVQGATESADHMATGEFGRVMGTAAYMSPEQARGLPVDRRTDIWAFGCVLYEMLAGRVAFDGETASDSIAKVLEREPDWSVLPAGTPLPVRRLLRRALAKTPKQRLKDAGDARLEIDAADEPLPVPPPAPRSSSIARWAPWAALVALALTFGVSLTWRPDPNPLAGATFTLLTGFEGSEIDAAISPDGNWVAFLADVEGPFHVWLSQIAAGHFRNVTPNRPDQQNPGLLRAVGFSGDGSELWLFTGDTPGQLRRMPLLGGEPRAFLPNGSANAVWSPDRARLAYHGVNNGDPIFVADGNGGNPREIFRSANEEHNHFPAWSPDGHWIYYTHGRQSVSEFDVWRIPSAGGTPQRLTELNTNVRYVTPIDARTVLFVAPDVDRSGPWLWALDVERKTVRRVTVGLERYLSVSASADGRRIVASVATPTAGLWSVPLLDRTAGDDDVKPYRLPAVQPRSPRFSGSSLYYLSSGDGPAGLWRVQDGKAAEIWKGSNGMVVEPPAVSPKGDRIAMMVSRPDGSLQLTLVSSDGAIHHTVADQVAGTGTPTWSPDGSRIVMGGRDKSGPGLFMIKTDDGSVTRLVDGEAYDPVWSPKDELIVYTAAQGGGTSLRAIRPDGKAVGLPAIDAMENVAVRARRRLASTRFLPDGRGFVFMIAPPGQQAFWLMDFTANATRLIARLSQPSEITTFDITPDGKSLVFDRVEERANLVLIDRGR